MIDFTNDSFLAAQRLKDFPYYTRPLCQYFIPAVKRVFHHFGLSEELIVPIINSRENVKGKPKDLLQWLSENAGDRSKETISQISLHVAFAAIHTSAIGVTHILFDLCAMPEYIDPIREEVAAALESTDGLPSKKSFLKMPKLDSFMRESQRFNPLLLSQSQVRSRAPSSGLLLLSSQLHLSVSFATILPSQMASPFPPTHRLAFRPMPSGWTLPSTMSPPNSTAIGF